MRRRMALIAAALSAAALAACVQDDQKLPFSLEDDRPVTRTVPTSGDLTISTPAGLSMTLPEGAVSPGSEVTIARIDVPDLTGGPELVGNSIYVIGFDEVPQKDPVVTFTATLEKEYTAGELIGMVPVVVRAGSGGGATFSKGRAPAGQARFDQSDVRRRLKRIQSGLAGIDLAGQFQDPPDGQGTVDDLVQQVLQQQQELLNQHGGPPFQGPPPLIIRYVTAPESFGLLATSTGSENSWQEQDAQEWLALYLDKIQNQNPNGNAPAKPAQYVVYPTTVATLAVGPLPAPGTSIGGVDYPLIPDGHTSATFELVCTGVEVDEEIAVCDHGGLDIRAGAELLKRFPATLLAVKYIAAGVTLRSDGTAAGQVEYDVAVRAPLASGITGYALNDTHDFTGTWSASGDSIHVGGRSYRYATPDPETVILLIEDTVKLENNDGTKSREPVQIYLKLHRI